MDGTGLPDRISIDSASPYFWPDYRKLGVRIDGVARRGDVHELCVSEGWAMVRRRNRWGYMVKDGHYLLERIEGKIEPYFMFEQDPATSADRQKAAEEKRARKAAKRLREGGAGMGARPEASYS